VFPSSWYPDGTAVNVQRWTVPSCRKCNGKFGELEKELFAVLALCIDPTKAEAAGISKKALASMGIGAANLSTEEKAHRKAFQKRILGTMKPLDELTDVPFLPTLGPHRGFSATEQRSIEFSGETLKLVSEKVLRGCEYKLNNKRYVEEPYRLEVYFPREDGMDHVSAILAQVPATTLGPGFEVKRCATRPEECYAVLYRVTVWGTVRIYASIGREEDLQDLARKEKQSMPDIGPPPEPINSAPVDFSKHWSILDQTKAEFKNSGRSGVVIIIEPDAAYTAKLTAFLASFNTPPTWNKAKPYLLIEHATQAEALYKLATASGLKAELIIAGAA